MKLECRNLTKDYKKTRALDGFTFEFTPGIYGLLGPNGAGKTTLMNLITDNLKPTSGEVLCDGVPIKELGSAYRAKIGFMPQQQNIYPAFTVERFLWYMAGLKDLDKNTVEGDIKQLLEQVNLYEDRKKRLGELSGGMKQRALLAQALLGKPELIILDEPTAGVDPKERIQMRNIISRVGFESIIIIATHVVPDIQFIAKDVLLLDKGKVIKQGAPGKLSRNMQGKVFEIVTDDKGFEDIRNRYRIVNVHKDEEEIRVRVVNDTVPEHVHKACEVKPDLEDLYLYHFE
ncbi:MAG: ATP-binding cassette domain-containing protein [Lachnospiraceae bacterium]|nr:ATP-binding cassette domain-containing protein [Lachnospiraceae bacterium]MBR4815798.1 ATP-binding cassette domain-containing protein [Lachnospiraceae bacterium]